MSHKIDPTKPCELCEAPRVKGERFCPKHRAAKLKEMEQSGYFVDPNELTVFEYERRVINKGWDMKKRQLREDYAENAIDLADSINDRHAESEA